MTAQTKRLFANTGVSVYDGRPALYLPDVSNLDGEAHMVTLEEDYTSLGALDDTIRDAGFDVVGEWQIDMDADLVREIKVRV